MYKSFYTILIKLALNDLHFRPNTACFCLFCVSEKWMVFIYWMNEFGTNQLNTCFSDSLINVHALFPNESAVWMNRLNLNDSLINSHLLSPTGDFNLTLSCYSIWKMFRLWECVQWMLALFGVWRLKEWMQRSNCSTLTLCWRWIQSRPWKTKTLSAVSMTATLTSAPLREENNSDCTHLQKRIDNSSKMIVHFEISSELSIKKTWKLFNQKPYHCRKYKLPFEQNIREFWLI